ncbi:MAG: rod shape-determining protein MreD [Candidatus Omnitrophica bacterium]|nr:rod shape-determining protein MreD [Candidatus Omnitrophota bacterium]
MFKIRFRTVRFVFIAYIVLIFQASLVNLISFKNCKPDLVLLSVIFFGLYNGPRRGAWCGLGLGLCLDVLSSAGFGVNGVILGFIGYFSGLLQERVYATHFLTHILVPFAAGILQVFLYYVLAANFYRVLAISESLIFIAGYVAYTAAINIIFFKILDRLVILRTTKLTI